MEQAQKKATIIIVGAGNRGKVYAQYALEQPALCQVVGVCEPRDITRERMAKEYNIPPNRVWKDWKDLAAIEEKLSDAVVITTQDRMHTEPAIAFASKGYHILLEKPMAPTEDECRAIVNAVEKNKVIFAVGHVLRYTPYTQKIKQLVSSGAIGRVINMQHLEPIGWYHFAHSYVRGNWRNLNESSFMLMAKSCHDIDWVQYILGTECVKVSSFGSLAHFRKEEKPTGAGTRCMDCSIDRIKQGHTKWPVHVLSEIPTVESITEALEKGPYGRCVYECDNDVMDNQVVNMQFKDGSTASFTAVAFSKEVCIRKTRIFGTRGEIEGDGHKITHFDFMTQKTTTYTPDDDFHVETRLSGHGGADYYLMKSFIDAVGLNEPHRILSSAKETLRSHLVVFEAEKSRLENKVRDLSW